MGFKFWGVIYLTKQPADGSDSPDRPALDDPAVVAVRKLLARWDQEGVSESFAESARKIVALVRGSEGRD